MLLFSNAFYTISCLIPDTFFFSLLCSVSPRVHIVHPEIIAHAKDCVNFVETHMQQLLFKVTPAVMMKLCGNISAYTSKIQ